MTKQEYRLWLESLDDYDRFRVEFIFGEESEERVNEIS